MTVIYPEVLKLLLEQGASSTAKDHRGRTPAHCLPLKAASRQEAQGSLIAVLVDVDVDVGRLVLV